MAIIQRDIVETTEKVSSNQKSKLIRGFLFACTNKSESECLNRQLFATDKIYGPVVLRIRKGDFLFLNNVDTDSIYGIFKAISNGGFKIDPSAFGGKYPYQVKVEATGNTICSHEAQKILDAYEFKRNTPLFKTRLFDFLKEFIANEQDDLALGQNNLNNIIEDIKKDKSKIDIELEIPLIESTTLWDFPKQSYGLTPKGNNKYAGVTPALIIYNLIWRYTDPGELVIDPMCGSGTTIDVCREEKREVLGYDIVPTRPDIIQNDARKIPLPDNFADMIFIDSPYGDNIKYNLHPDNFGVISSESEEFYDELEKVMKESHRVLRDGKVLGWLIGDQWVKKMFTPVGFKIYERLCKYFEPVEIICVARRSQYSNTGVWHNRARRFNFYLRGFKYLIIVKKTAKKANLIKPRKIEWSYYQRG